MIISHLNEMSIQFGSRCCIKMPILVKDFSLIFKLVNVSLARLESKRVSIIKIHQSILCNCSVRSKSRDRYINQIFAPIIHILFFLSKNNNLNFLRHTRTIEVKTAIDWCQFTLKFSAKILKEEIPFAKSIENSE